MNYMGMLYQSIVRIIMISTTSDERIYYNMGNGFVTELENPHPECKLYKKMPCGHQGLWVYDRCGYARLVGVMRSLIVLGLGKTILRR